MSKTLEQSDLDAARAAKTQARETFAALVPVVGVGITRVDGVYGVKVNLQKMPDADVLLPTEIDGVPVRVEVVGKVQKQAIN